MGHPIKDNYNTYARTHAYLYILTHIMYAWLIRFATVCSGSWGWQLFNVSGRVRDNIN